MRLGTPLARNAKRVMLLGSGELGKEVLIALQRLGIDQKRFGDSNGVLGEL